MLLSLSHSGISFVGIVSKYYIILGADVGGFTGNPSDEMLIRWFQVLIFIK